MFKRKKIWFNLHLLFSCIFALPILVLCITGSMLSYDKEIMNYYNNKYSKIIIEDKEALGVEDLLSKFGEQKPDVNLASIRISSIKGAPVRISADPKGIRWSSWEYIINPYSGEIITKNYAPYIMLTIKRIHVWFGFHWNNWTPYGNQISGTSTLIFIFLIISGIYLYFPFMKRKFINSLKIDIKAKGYKLLYNLHSVLGVWLSILFLLMSFSGIYMAYYFVQSMVDPIFGLEKVKGPNRFSIIPEPLDTISTINIGKRKEIVEAFDMAKKAINNDYSQLSLVVSGMTEKSFLYVFHYYAKNESNMSRGNSKSIAINMKRKRVVQAQGVEVKEKSAGFNKQKMNKIVTGLHYGNFFGSTGTFIWFISCLLFVVFPITGFMMTYRRMKRKRV